MSAGAAAAAGAVASASAAAAVGAAPVPGSRSGTVLGVREGTAAGATRRTVDVVVVGGGIAGASLTWELARRGLAVHLVEQEGQAGHHATGRSAALLNETVGHPVVGALARASRGFLDAPPPGFVDHDLLAPRGLLWVGEDPAALDVLAEAAPAGSARRIDAAAATALVPALRPSWAAAGGVHEPEARSVDVAALLQAYLRGARRHGAEVSTGHEAVGATPRDGGGWRVTTPGIELDCATVVDAAGAWGDVVAARAGVAPLGLTPLRRTACIVPVPDRVDGPGGAAGPGSEVRTWPLVMDVAGGFYAEPEPGGLLVSPADETPAEPGDARPEELDVALGLDRLREATTLPIRSVRRVWAGLRTFAPDRAPVAGYDPDAPGFYWLVGQGGAGIKTAPALAALAAADITGEPLDEPVAAAGLTAQVVTRLRPDRLRP